MIQTSPRSRGSVSLEGKVRPGYWAAIMARGSGRVKPKVCFNILTDYCSIADIPDPLKLVFPHPVTANRL